MTEILLIGAGWIALLWFWSFYLADRILAWQLGLRSADDVESLRNELIEQRIAAYLEQGMLEQNARYHAENDVPAMMQECRRRYVAGEPDPVLEDVRQRAMLRDMRKVSQRIEDREEKDK
ncbi:MAG: hypothetical protein H6958_11875 [Chromatiaceae bacterium]|nr:hypothetical protein [Chromatiaceae bacterium]